MTNTTTAKRRRAGILPIALLGLTSVFCQAAPATPASPDTVQTQTVSDTLSARQQAIVPIAAFAAAGDISRLSAALNQGLDAGLTVSDVREVLVQVYAYAGFPRSLNALGELMKVLEAQAARYPGCTGACSTPSHSDGRGTACRWYRQSDEAGRPTGAGASV